MTAVPDVADSATRRTRLVVADDDAPLLEMLVGLLDDLGYDVVATAGDGGRAVEECLRAEPDLVLLDHRMPGQNGADAARELARLMPELPVIILSAYDDPSLQQAHRDLGARDYLVKGCSAEQIRAAIDAAVVA